MKASILLTVIIVLLGGCTPKCPKPTTPPPPCPPQKSDKALLDYIGRSILKSRCTSWCMRESFGEWISAWGANPACGNFFVHPSHPGKIGVVCRIPGRGVFTYFHPLPVGSDSTLGQCSADKLTPVKVVAYGTRFGLWAKKAAMKTFLNVKYQEGVPHLCTRQDESKCVPFPLSDKRKACLQTAYRDYERRKRLVAQP